MLTIRAGSITCRFGKVVAPVRGTKLFMGVSNMPRAISLPTRKCCRSSKDRGWPLSSIERRPYSTLTGTFLLSGFGHGVHGGRGNSGALQRRRKRRLGIWEICCFGTAAARPWLVKVGRSHVGSSPVANRNSEERWRRGDIRHATWRHPSSFYPCFGVLPVA